MPTGIYPIEKRGGMFKKGHKHSKEVLEKIIKSRNGFKHTEETKQKIRETNLRLGRIPPNNYGKFRDGNARYVAVHQWVVREKGREDKCEHCHTDKLRHRQYQWANIDHKYNRNLNDYIRLCVKCHRKYDKENNLLI